MEGGENERGTVYCCEVGAAGTGGTGTGAGVVSVRN